MTDDEGIVRGYSQDRQTYRQAGKTMLEKRTSIEIYRQSNDYYSNRNCPEILSIFALQQRHKENREKRIYNSAANDEHYLNMVNYQIQSPSATPRAFSPLESLLAEEKQAALPKIAPFQTRKSENSTEENKQSNLSSVTPSESKNREDPNKSSTIPSNAAKKFPIITSKTPSKATSTNRNPILAARTTMKSIPSSSTNKMPVMMFDSNRKGRTQARWPH